MKRILILGGLLISAFLIAPVALMADDHHGERRYYDRDGRDYHYWSGDEDRQYRVYLTEHHHRYVPFVHYRHRREYFRYRHEHGFKVEIR